MKKRTKKKLKKRSGYKRYDNYQLYLNAQKVIRTIQSLIDNDMSTLIMIHSTFGNDYKHKISTSREHNNCNPIRNYIGISIYVYEVKSFKEMDKYIYSKRGELFYNIIRKHIFVTDYNVFIFGDTRYNNNRFNGLFYLADSVYPTGCELKTPIDSINIDPIKWKKATQIVQGINCGIEKEC